jgi:hypothetical protein
MRPGHDAEVLGDSGNGQRAGWSDDELSRVG